MTDPPWRKPEHVNVQTKKLRINRTHDSRAKKYSLYPGRSWYGGSLSAVDTRAWPERGHGFLLGLAIIFFVIGGCTYSWCVFDFASFGRGTPAPIDAPKKLVRRGLYRYSRNPMYVGVLTVIYSWAILYQSIAVTVYGIVVACCFYSFVVFFEEPILKKRFGIEYEHYCAEVPRWLFR